MGRFRSFVRKVAKPAAMVAVAGMLAVSLTVTTTQRAEANPLIALPVVAAAESIVGGASLPLVMPSLAATVLAVTPVGWVIAGGIAVAALALGAYYTKDYWLPYVTGAFGGGKTDGPSTAGTGTGMGTINSNFSLGGITVSGTQLTMATTYNCTTGCTVNLHVSYRLRCKEPSGTIKVFEDVRNYINQAMTSGSTSLPVMTYSCQYTTGGVAVSGTPVGFEAGLAGDSGLPLLEAGDKASGPANHKWYGDATQGSFDPRGSDVKYRSTVECISDAGVKSTITADWLGSDGAAKMPSCAAAGKGHGTGVNKIDGYAPTAPGVPGTVPQTIWSTAAPAVDPNYAKCDQGRPGAGCEMAITIDGKRCVIGQWECANWSDLWKDSTTSARVGCTYGPYTLSPDACSIMEPAYRPGGAPLTEENTDGNPSTRNNVDLSGQPFTPETKPGTVPGGAGAPSPTGDRAMYDCWPQGWGVFNPADWVAKPIRCAFEPKQDLTARNTALKQKAEVKAPISFIVGMPMTGPGGGGCPAWNITIPGVMSKNVVCDSSFTSALLAVRGPLFALVATAMVWPLLRSIWYAAIPVLRVTPSSGGK